MGTVSAYMIGQNSADEILPVRIREFDTVTQSLSSQEHPNEIDDTPLLITTFSEPQQYIRSQ